MKKVRIIALHLAYGGVEKAIISMANLFAEKFDVEIISVYDMPNAPAFPVDERVKLRYLLKDRPNRAEWKAAVKSKNLAAIVRESFKSVKVLAGKKLAVIKTIRSVGEGVLICTRHEDNLLLSRFGREGVLKIAQLHHDHHFEKKYVHGFAKAYGNIDVFALLTPGLAGEVREIMKDNERTRVVAIPNFLERYPSAVPVSGREKTVVAVGRLESVKGFDRLIRIFNEFHRQAPDWKLKIIGDGTERPRLEELISVLGLDGAVILAGRMDGAQIEAEMLNASIFSMTSHSEGFGFVIVEAQSCGLPAVAFDVRVGPAYILRDGVDGFLVPDEDEKAFAGKLLELADSPEMRERMSQKALERSRDFSRENVAKQWFDVLGE